MSSDRFHRRTALLGFLTLAGCGFAPVHRNDSGLRGMIQFETDSSVAGFRLRERLDERLGPTVTPRYQLTVTLLDRRRTSAITAEGDTTRFNVIGTANWVLTDTSTGARLETGKVETFTSYGTTGSTVATQAAESDAIARLSVALADVIVSRLLIMAPSLRS